MNLEKATTQQNIGWQRLLAANTAYVLVVNSLIPELEIMTPIECPKVDSEIRF